MSGLVCLLVYVILTVAASAAIFVRATRKRDLIRLAEGHFEQDPLRDAWAAASGGLWPYLGDVRRLRFLTAHLATVPNDIRVAHNQYSTANTAAIGLIFLLLSFALFGHRICS
jgi:hypothetical protein